MDMHRMVRRPWTPRSRISQIGLPPSRCAGWRPGSMRVPQIQPPLGQFLANHGDAVGENLRRGVRCALRALEIAVRGEALWDRVAASLPREPRHLLLPQLWGLRDVFGRATSADQKAPAAAELARALQQLRLLANPGAANEGAWADLCARAGLPERAPDDLPAEAEVRLASPVADALCRAGAERLAQLLLLKSRHGELLFVGLVDFFASRALQADPRVGAEFVFVHVQRPQELCGRITRRKSAGQWRSPRRAARLGAR
jgi:hypothetical protein